MIVTKVDGIDIYRDGGSYGLFFKAKNNKWFSFSKWYELLLQNRSFEKKPDTDYYPPKIYLEDCNSGNIVKTLTWGEAKLFISSLSYADEKFNELVKIINNEGKST